MRTHTWEKPNLCSQCKQFFKTDGNLKKHSRKHTGRKPYHCHQCTKSLSQDKNLNISIFWHKLSLLPFCGSKLSSGLSIIWYKSELSSDLSKFWNKPELSLQPCCGSKLSSVWFRFWLRQTCYVWYYGDEFYRIQNMVKPELIFCNISHPKYGEIWTQIYPNYG